MWRCDVEVRCTGGLACITLPNEAAITSPLNPIEVQSPPYMSPTSISTLDEDPLSVKRITSSKVSQDVSSLTSPQKVEPPTEDPPTRLVAMMHMYTETCMHMCMHYVHTCVHAHAHALYTRAHNTTRIERA